MIRTLADGRKVFSIEMDRLDDDFVNEIDRLSNKYGEKLQQMNNFHNTNLNFSDFIDAFIDASTPADVSSDGNANSSAKDICTLMSDMMKPHTKLLGYNKLFYELKKRYGKSKATVWLEDEWTGAQYLHDGSSVSFKPYSYKGSESVLVRYKGSDKLLINMDDLFGLVEEPVELLSEEDRAICKYPKDLEIWDVNGWVNVSRVICKQRDEKFHFIKTQNGMSEVVTANHPIITTNRGDVRADEIRVDEDVVTTLAPESEFGTVDEIFVTNELLPYGFPIWFRGFPATETSYYTDGFVSYNKGINPIPNRIKVDYDFGWLIGMIIGDGSLAADNRSIHITQQAGEYLDRMINVLEKIGLGYYLTPKSGSSKNIYNLSIRSTLFTDLVHTVFTPPSKAYTKRLNPNIMRFNREFIKGIIGGIIDSDGTIGGVNERRLHIRVASRHLVTQLGHLIRMFGYNTREQTPSIYKPYHESKIIQSHYIYHLAVTPYSDGEWFDSIKAGKILKNLNTREESCRHHNNKYAVGFGDHIVSNNYELSDVYEEDEHVYDITTETGHFMCNGILSHNCYAYDLDKLVEKGLYFVNKFPTGPAKHLTTFNDHVLEFISWNCNRTSGAVGLPSYIVYSWWFWWNDVKNGFFLKDPEYYRKQCFQKFVYDLNQPYLRVSESAFTNISVMDRNYLTELFGGRMFPDGTFAIDHIEEIIEHQKVFMEVVAKIRETTMMTFPVLSFSLLYQKEFIDEEFARWCSDHNTIWYDSNFYVGEDVTSLSNCCFDGRQEVTIRHRDNIYRGAFKIMYQTFHDKTIQVFYNGVWRDAKLTALNEKHPIFEIKTEDGRTLRATDDHIHLTTEGELKSWQLETGMKLLVETNNMEKIDTNLYGYDKIISIERVEQEDDWVFCVEVEDKEYPYFCLTNGIQTHNCRLISDTSKITAFINSIGGTSLSIGSVKVNDINLRRISLESKGDEDKFMEILKERVDTCVKALDCVRHIIKRNVEKGLLPNYTHGLIDMEKQYNTVGITAMYEVMLDFGYIETDEFGNRSYSPKAMAFAKRIMKQINEQKDSYGFEYSLNVENSPKPGFTKAA